jgi:hypothetical protein
MKGQVDIIYLMVTVFVVVLAVFVVNVLWAGFQSSPTYQQLQNATPTGKLAGQNTTTSLHIVNNAIAILYIIGAIASVIAAAFADSSAVFIVPALVLLPLEILFSFIFHDMFFSIMTNSFFSSMVTSAPLVFELFQYLPVISFGLAIVAIIVTFMK